MSSGEALSSWSHSPVQKRSQSRQSSLAIEQYWWILTIISVIIVFLITLSCLLGWRQYKQAKLGKMEKLESEKEQNELALQINTHQFPEGYCHVKPVIPSHINPADMIIQPMPALALHGSHSKSRRRSRRRNRINRYHF